MTNFERDEVEARLRVWMPRQRWFAGRGQTPAAARIETSFPLPGEGEMLLAEAAGERYLIVTNGDALDGVAGANVRRGLWDRVEWDQAPPPAAGDSEIVGTEQSNTSIIYRDPSGARRWILKLFRRLRPGVNPDDEIPAALGRIGFRFVPATLGRIHLAPYTVAVLQEFLPNQGDGWEFTLRQLRQGGDCALGLLGRRTAELHQALAAALGTEPATAADLAGWTEAVAADARVRAGQLRERGLAPEIARRLECVPATPGELTRFEGLAKIRVHGDYHLGQVLRTESDFAIFDFEGEPARPIEERRRRGCALKDVAGMLRSFSYAAHTLQRENPARAADWKEWERQARRDFIAGYDAAAGAPEWLPADPEARARGLRFFEREKAIYELGYELAHRPDWIELPLAGLAELL